MMADEDKRTEQKETEATEPACETCGNPEPKEIRTCLYCGAAKCNMCDMGDDVECMACEREEE